MPKVDGKEFPYTDDGQAAAAVARKRTKKKGASLDYTPEKRPWWGPPRTASAFDDKNNTMMKDGKKVQYMRPDKESPAPNTSKASINPLGFRGRERRGRFDEEHAHVMTKGGKDVQYKTMDEKQADIRKQGKAKKDETAARKRGVDAHKASGTLKSLARNKKQSDGLGALLRGDRVLARSEAAGEREKKRLQGMPDLAGGPIADQLKLVEKMKVKKRREEAP